MTTWVTYAETMVGHYGTCALKPCGATIMGTHGLPNPKHLMGCYGLTKVEYNIFDTSQRIKVHLLLMWIAPHGDLYIGVSTMVL